MFKFYASQDKKEINFNLAHAMKRISFNEFIKFGFSTNITPHVVSNDDMVLIFRSLVREASDKLTQKEIDEMGIGLNSLSFEDFKKALIRIAIIGQEFINNNKYVKIENKL